ncbi:hypothetical protein J6590_003165 [Homalodisca vitripennis]|nr:hypothetical protein J6590_003165 [Homalodisca vitripennis]
MARSKAVNNSTASSICPGLAEASMLIATVVRQGLPNINGRIISRRSHSRQNFGSPAGLLTILPLFVTLITFDLNKQHSPNTRSTC